MDKTEQPNLRCVIYKHHKQTNKMSLELAWISNDAILVVKWCKEIFPHLEGGRLQPTQIEIFTLMRADLNQLFVSMPS